MDDVDGLASFADDRNEAIFLAAELGLPELRFANMVWMPGGGGGCAAISNAAMAVETGQAEVVVVYRSLCQGQFFRFGQGGPKRASQGAVSPPRLQHASSLMLASLGFTMPYGLIMSAAPHALPIRRHMHLDPQEISLRHDVVEQFVRRSDARDGARRQLGGVRDIERLLARCVARTAGARDLLGLRGSLERLPE